MKRVDCMFFDAGGGHRSAATALRDSVARLEFPWDFRLVNLQELFDPLDVVRRLTGVRIQDLYNLMLRKEWTLGSAQLLHVLRAVINLYHNDEVALLEKFWREQQPDLVVSVIPHFNRALYQALQRVDPRAPYVTVITDLADYPPHLWIEPQKQFYVCGTSRAVLQAREMGIPDEVIYRTSGMILRPHFYEPIPVDREAERARLGLDPKLPTALVMFGGQGSSAMPEIVSRLDSSGLSVQFILLCGRNESLKRKLEERPSRLRCHVEGFTKEVPYFMHLADFFIGKPGPGSISEALAMRLPVIVECNAWTLPQERYNAQWVRENEVGITISSFREIAKAVSDLLTPLTLSRLRANAATLNNRAVFEIPPILDEILHKAESDGSVT